MTTTYHVRIYCEDFEEYKRIEQVDTLDNTWKPESCSGHTTRDFVIEETIITP